MSSVNFAIPERPELTFIANSWAQAQLGFTLEGVFRQHMIVKGSNRDTTGFAMLDSEWPACKAALERWLDPANFDADGRQKSLLSAASR